MRSKFYFKNNYYYSLKLFSLYPSEATLTLKKRKKHDKGVWKYLKLVSKKMRYYNEEWYLKEFIDSIQTKRKGWWKRKTDITNGNFVTRPMNFELLLHKSKQTLLYVYVLL